MTKVNYRTYQLIKEDKVLIETESATFDRAVDYFFDVYPQAYSDPSYTFKIAKTNYRY
jgi:hypothetical protein